MDLFYQGLINTVNLFLIFQEPFVIIPDQKIRKALNVLLGTYE